MQAGLGGGSSDAAAALRALGRLWRVECRPREGDRAVARRRRALFFRGRNGARARARRRVVSAHRRAGRLGRSGHPLVRRQHKGSLRLVRRRWSAKATGGRQVRHTPTTNDLQGVVAQRHPEIAQLVRALKRAGAADAAMSGSGSAVFGLFSTRRGAAGAAAALASVRVEAPHSDHENRGSRDLSGTCGQLNLSYTLTVCARPAVGNSHHSQSPVIIVLIETVPGDRRRWTDD